MGVAEDYRFSVVPLVIQRLGYQIDWTSSAKADLIVFGPFFNLQKRFRWVPKPLRPTIDAMITRLQHGHRPLTLFQTGENLRHNHIPCDYSLSSDLAVDDPGHCRFPYWMEMVDWSHEGITGNANPRFGKLLSLDRLMSPLGNTFLQKPRRAAIFASHIREPRATLIRALERHIPVQGFGPVFDPAVSHHAKSNFTKLDVLKDFAFNLCPENSMYPGYYTEKIPESFASDSAPITWVDENVVVDFNPKAMINLAPMMHSNFQELDVQVSDRTLLQAIAAESLLHRRPTLEKTIDLLTRATSEAVR